MSHVEPPTPLDRLAAMLNAPAPLPSAERVRIYLDALQHASEIGRPLLRASLQIHLAKALLDDRSGTRAESIELAITALSEAVGIFRDHSSSIPRAEAWTLLASAHLERIRGVRQENVEAAIRFCRKAFQVQNRRSRPDSWAEVADCLAGALAARSGKHRAIDQGKSLDLFRRVLPLRRKDPAGWVSTAVNLAKALSESISGDRSGNIEEAIRLLRRAEEVLSGKRDASPKWATVQINLAVMYREHLRGDRTAHREQAIEILSRLLAMPSVPPIGITDQELPDEALGFPAAFLQVGVPAVVSTLWPVDDAPTALLLIRFYQHHLADRMEPALALRQAQIWLRTSTVRELRLVERCERILQESRSPHPAVYQGWRRYQKQPEAIPFQNPYFWAGFVSTGFAHATSSAS